MKTSLAVVLVIAGCSSNDPVVVAGADAADSMDSMVMDSHVHPTDSATDTSAKDAGAMLSADCKTYCDCFEANCASIQAIPGGLSCGDFCAGFTKDQWTCRNAHCQLVVPEKNPGHCQHAVGIDQCI